MVQTLTSSVDMLSCHPTYAVLDLHSVNKDLKMSQPLAFEEKKTQNTVTATIYAPVHRQAHALTPFSNPRSGLVNDVYEDLGKDGIVNVIPYQSKYLRIVLAILFHREPLATEDL